VTYTESEIETPKDLLRRIYDEEFGFIPTNASMKPVHVANGMARRVLGTQTDFAPLARLLRQFVDNQKGGFKEERNPNSAILTDYGDRFTDRFDNPPTDEAMTRFRSLAKDTLGADDAVFPTLASFTLSHARMVTNDISDNGAGDFLASFMMAGTPARPDKAAALLRDLLSSDTDPWTTIGWPLLNLGEEHDATPGAAAQVRADRSAALLATDKKGVLVSPTLRVLRDRYDQLAEYEAAHGSKLTTLRRLVLFGVFATHVHIIRRCHDVIPDGPQPPLLLDLFDGHRRSLREASAATLQAGFRAVERLIVHRIVQHMTEVCGDDPETYVSSLPSADQWDAVKLEFAAQAAGSEPVDALAEAFWKVGYSRVGPKEVQGFPWNTLLALGRRAGYLLPYDNRGRGGKEHKRYGANAEFAELLVASTVTPGDPGDFDDFLDRLRESFGIVVGRTVDFDVIRHNDLHPGATVRRSVSVIESDLRANLHTFRDLIIDIGFAKSYADGRTVVTTDETAA
jgi:hypothetical protein